MSDEQHDRAPDDAPANDYCTTKPQVGDRLTARCTDCDHATLLHVGTTHCPVCELVDLNAQARAAPAMAIELNAEPASLAERAWAAVQARHAQTPPAAMATDGP